VWSRNKANLYIQDALADFHYDPKALPSPPVQYRMYRDKLMLTHLVGFGGAAGGAGTSYFFDGSSDALTAPDHADWILGGGTGVFTVDWWHRHSSIGSSLYFGMEEDGDNRYNCFFHASNGITFHEIDGASVNINENQGATTGWSALTWYHMALIRGWGGVTDDWAFTRDGSTVMTFSNASAIGNHADLFRIGSTGQASMDGFTQEFRLSDIARWTADFSASLPTVEYTSDANTQLLIHCNETIASGTTGSGATFVDSGNTGHTMTEVNQTIRSSAQYKF